MKPTKSFLEPTPGCRLAPLVDAWRVKDVADASRSAALGFAWGGRGLANRRWGRLELARWLTGPYARALAPTRHLGRGPRSQRVTCLADRRLDERSVEEVILQSHARLVEALRQSWSWVDDPTFARDVVDSGLVAGVADDFGGIGYAPLDAPDMRLFDRVRSLFIADFLTRPHDYAKFGVCDGCDAVTFDWSGLHDDCSTAFRAPSPTPSRIVLRARGRRSTLLGTG